MRYVSFKGYKTIPEGYLKDIPTLRQTLNNNDVYTKDWDIYCAWSAFSSTWCAGWLLLSNFSEDEMYDMLMEYLE